ncbi:MAG TPA: FAD-binding oxidoreductase, partial [Stellaceae bacterium]|nr:FAD-binding oxidoreductase [Stellaceae bacterium]
MPSAFNSALNIERSYYQATANPFARAPKLESSATADLVVIGGGTTGLSAALFAAGRGYSVVLLEAGRIGWGASGRNGGQMIPGLRKSALELVRLYGRERAQRIFGVADAARDLVVDLVGRHGIACDLRRTGHLEAAIKPHEPAELAAEAECQATVMGYPHMDVLDREAVRAEVASERYHGGLIDRRGGHMHTLNYTLGLAEAARKAGAALYEDSPAIALDHRPGGVTVRTASGEVRATYGLLACDAFLGDLDPGLAGHIMPVANYIVATEKLPDAAALIPNDRAVSDTKFVVDYYRRTADGRLLFGGGERYTPAPPADIAGFVRPYLERAFPQLRGVEIEHAWGGMVSVTLTR